eukprot:1160494-Pelagomonas_calceolata.AAC.13
MDSEHLTPTHAHTHTADKACFTRRGRPQYLPQAVQAWRQKGLGATLWSPTAWRHVSRGYACTAQGLKIAFSSAQSQL